MTSFFKINSYSAVSYLFLSNDSPQNSVCLMLLWIDEKVFLLDSPGLTYFAAFSWRESLTPSLISGSWPWLLTGGPWFSSVRPLIF